MGGILAWLVALSCCTLGKAGPTARRSLSERSRLINATGGYKQQTWEPVHAMQLSGNGTGTNRTNGICVMCLDNVAGERDENGTTHGAVEDVLLMICGHWVCGDCDFTRDEDTAGRLRRGSVSVACPTCREPLEPFEKRTRRTRRRVLWHPFCVARSSWPPDFYGRGPRDPEGDGGGGVFGRAPRSTAGDR